MPPRKTSRWSRPLPHSVLSLWYRMSPIKSRLRSSKAVFVGLLLATAISVWYFTSGHSLISSNRRHRYVNVRDQGELAPELDNSGDHMIVGPLRGDAALGPDDRGTGGRRVMLATHCSPSNIHELYSLLLDAWHGPASIAVFVNTVDSSSLAAPSAAARQALDRLLAALLALVACRDDAWVYIVYPVASNIRVAELVAAAAGQQASCADLLTDLQAVSRLHAGRNYDRDGGSVVSATGSPYPGNMLRNVALRRARHYDYVLVVDVDMTPSADLHERLSEFLFGAASNRHGGGGGDDHNRRVAYVLPCFESKHGKGVSLDRPTLERLWRLGLVRPFYAEACRQCQSTTDYNRWMSLSGVAESDPSGSSGEAVRVAYEAVRQRSDAWEPFFVARKQHLPPYDERFKQYGYNRISQICEMHMLGFQFFVLDNAFLVHKGFKTELSFHSSKNAELENNTKLYRQFRWEMKERYPNGREC